MDHPFKFFDKKLHKDIIGQEPIIIQIGQQLIADNIV